MTVAFAMLADYAVSMTVTPVVLARLYSPHGNESGTMHRPPTAGSASSWRPTNRSSARACG